MLFTYEMLIQNLDKYKAPENKIKRLCDNKELTKLTRNLYITDKNISGACVANAIYSPSYLSFEYALSYYGLIPEAVYIYTSATYKKNKQKIYKNDLGTFLYKDVPAKVYSLEVNLFTESNYTYAMASPEKALCDKLYQLKPLKSKTKLLEMLFDDLRIDKEKFYSLNFKTLLQLCPLYRSSNLNLLEKIIGDIYEHITRYNDIKI